MYLLLFSLILTVLNFVSFFDKAESILFERS